MSEIDHGTCTPIHRMMNNKSGYTICVGHDPYPGEGIPKTDTIKICRYIEKSDMNESDYMTPNEARGLGMSLINAAFLGGFNSLSNDQRETIKRLLKESDVT